MTPTYKHDCERCKFLGTDKPRPGEPPCEVVDLYIHNTTVIRRFSSIGNAYASADLDTLSRTSTSDSYKAKWARCMALALLQREFWR